MPERKTFTVTPETDALLREVKQDGETWDQCLQRLAKSIDGTVNETECVTPGDLEGFRTQLTNEVATEVENRLTRR